MQALLMGEEKMVEHALSMLEPGTEDKPSFGEPLPAMQYYLRSSSTV